MNSAGRLIGIYQVMAVGVLSFLSRPKDREEVHGASVWRTACGNCQDLFNVGMGLSGQKGTVSPMFCSPLESPFLSSPSPTPSSLATWSSVLLPSYFSYALLFPQPGLPFLPVCQSRPYSSWEV